MIELYKTGEVHTNGQNVFRKVGDKPRQGKFLLGNYFVGNRKEMYVCSRGYIDEYGVWDGEPLCPIYDFKVVSNEDT